MITIRETKVTYSSLITMISSQQLGVRIYSLHSV